jgi:hypothetical protein
MACPDLRPRIKDLMGQYRDAHLELAYGLDPSDKTPAPSWAKGGPGGALSARRASRRPTDLAEA